MKKLLPILLAVLGIGAGIGAGMLLRPDPAELNGHDAEACVPSSDAPLTQEALTEEDHDDAKTDHEYVKLHNQFIVPVVLDTSVSSLVLISLSLEVGVGQKESVFSREPKLRDAFLQVMFDHANLGGFEGAFTNSGNLDVLRSALLEVAHDAMGELITDILITDIARQDV